MTDSIDPVDPTDPTDPIETAVTPLALASARRRQATELFWIGSSNAGGTR